ncbi:type IV toxin-antitoxin system AbiEi family antitoxin domain-containing protein [Nocardioides sp.]|uniref:type IV toxin-antitoxin system AbiEi family antitoxin domain-containing protein n=1 Tax=Nocardioides sp. TaxID=35761 RepID=UPI002ED128F8
MADNEERDYLLDAVILRRELLAEGFTDSQIQAMVKAGELARVRHGTYFPGDRWATLTAQDRHRVLVRAVLKRAHPSTVATHVSAAVERGAPVWGIPLEEVHVTRTDGKTGRREAGIVHHRGVLTEDDVEILNGVPLSRAARCAVEVTTMTTVEPALVTVNGMLHAEMLTAEELAAEVEACKHWPDTLSTTIVLRLCDARVQSVAESRTMFLCWDQHLPRPEPQVPIRDESGWIFAYVDFAWEKEGVFLEFDGRIKYERFRREGETLEQFLMREKHREERICQLTGWVCIRITWTDLEDPVQTAWRIRRILQSRRRPAGA